MASEERAPPPYRTRHDFLMAFVANVAKTSATSVTGRQRGSQGPRPGKPNAGISGHDLAAQTMSNMRAIARLIASVADPESEAFTWSVRQVVANMVRWIHEGTPNAEQLKKPRSHATRHNYGCSPEEVSVRWERFLNELQNRTDNPMEDLERLCAWVEYEIRFQIHPLADGSGRLSTALVAWIMLRSGRYIPNYSFMERDEMHGMLRQGYEAFESYYLRVCFRNAEGNPQDPFFQAAAKLAAAS